MGARRRSTTTGTTDSAGARLADEVDAYVHGNLRDVWSRFGEDRTAWSLLNRVAHATFDDLAHFVSRHRGPPGAPMSDEVELAVMVLDDAPTPEALQRVQREVLWDLEAAMDAVERAGRRFTPAEVRCAVASALARPPAR